MHARGMLARKRACWAACRGQGRETRAGCSHPAYGQLLVMAVYFDDAIESVLGQPALLFCPAAAGHAGLRGVGRTLAGRVPAGDEAQDVAAGKAFGSHGDSGEAGRHWQTCMHQLLCHPGDYFFTVCGTLRASAVQLSPWQGAIREGAGRDQRSSRSWPAVPAWPWLSGRLHWVQPQQQCDIAHICLPLLCRCGRPPASECPGAYYGKIDGYGPHTLPLRHSEW